MAAADEAEWKPGSFTKNFSWGQERGLKQLHDCIRVGFGGRVEPVLRTEFAQRVAGKFNFYIPANFFLFNRLQPEHQIVADELVFQAINFEHSERFDRLAIIAFNLSYAGRFKPSAPNQRRPALWAHWYVRDRVAKQFRWDVSKVNANDIERFVFDDPRYHAQSARKLATNLNHLYKMGRLGDLTSERIEGWWVDALFLAMDRLIEDRKINRHKTRESQYAELLAESGFHEIAGPRSLEKDLATKHLLRLYIECGGPDRFSEEAVKERTEIRLKDVADFIAANSPDPVGAVHPTNPRVLKSIPATCAMLARYGAGFEIVDAMSLDDFDPAAFIKQRTKAALDYLQGEGIEPTMTAEQLLRLTRGK